MDDTEDVEGVAFHISDLISLTDGHIVSTRGMEGVFSLMCWMTQSKLSFNQMADARRVCRDRLIVQYPWLLDIEFSCQDFHKEDLSHKQAQVMINRFLEPHVSAHGAIHSVKPIPPEAWTDDESPFQKLHFGHDPSEASGIAGIIGIDIRKLFGLGESDG